MSAELTKTAIATPAKISARRRRCLCLIASGLTYEAAAKKLHVTKRTIEHYMAMPEMRAELDRAQREHLEALLRKGLEGASDMLDTLRAKASSERDSDCIAAAGKYLDTVLRLAAPDSNRTEITMYQTIEADQRQVRLKMMQLMASDPALMAAQATIAEREARLLAEARGKTGRVIDGQAKEIPNVDPTGCGGIPEGTSSQKSSQGQ